MQDARFVVVGQRCQHCGHVRTDLAAACPRCELVPRWHSRRVRARYAARRRVLANYARSAARAA